MSDTAEQSAASFPGSPLTARLVRRVREPLGVIDTRHPEHLGTRGTSWMGQRLELLDGWNTRYGLTPPTAPAERTSVTPAQPFVMRSALPPPGGTTRELPALPQFRVKRPVEVRGNDVSNADRVAAASNTGLAANAPAPLLHAPETASAPPSDGSRPHLLPLPVQREEGAEDQRRANQLPRISAPSADILPQHTQAPQAALPAAPAETFAALRPPSSVSDMPVGGQTPDLVLRRKAVERFVPPAPAKAPDAASDLPVAQSNPAVPLPGPMPVVQSRMIRTSSPAPIFLASAPIVLARKTGPAERHVRPEPAAGTAPEVSLAATAPEIPATRSVPGEAPIVWRRADAAGTDASSRSLSPPVSSAPSVQIMRTPSSGNSAQSLTTAPAPGTTALRSSSGGPDVDHLAQRVSRLIARQLTVERERRGMAP